MKKLILAALAASVALPSTAALSRSFTPEDLVELRRLGASTVSPDGSTLIFSLREMDLEIDGGRRDLWRLDLTTPDAEPTRFTETPDENENSPTISVDGQSVYYLSSVSGSNQVWMRPMAGGDAVQVTSIEADVAGYSIAPGSGRIALWFDEARDCAETSCADTEEPDNAGTGRTYDEIFVRHWSSWGDGTHSRLTSYALTNGVASGEGTVVSHPLTGNTPSRPFGGGEEIAWHPDGQSIFFAQREGGADEPTSTNLDIYRAPADGSTPPINLTTANPALDSLPTPSPDGRYLAYVAMATPGYESDQQVLHLLDLTTNESRALSAGWDRSIGSIAWSPDMQHIWLTAGDTLDTALFRYTLADGSIERFSGAGRVGSVSPQRDGSVLVTINNALAPNDIFRIGADQTISQVTNVNGDLLGDVDMPTSERFSFAGANGETVHGMIYRPAQRLGESMGPLPVTFYVHGGPQGSFGDSWSYRWNPAVMASHGYAVVTVDFHGSTGYGQDFTDSINNDWGGKPLEDLQLGLAHVLAENPWMDGERVCALGASYGGYMMNWIAGNWSDRFSCLVNHAGLFDLRPFYYATEELWFPEQDFGGPYYEREEAYERWNPVHHVENWQTPMLVIHGERDFRIPYSQSLGAFTALQRQDIPSRLVIFPDENHWINGPRNSLQWHNEVFNWVDRWLRPARDAAE